MKRRIFYIILAIVVLLISGPIFLSQILKLPFGYMTIGDENSWVGFFGGYLGALFGGLITLYVFWKTLNYTRQKDIIEMKNQRELKILNVRPYFTANPFYYNEKGKPETDHYIWFYIENNTDVTFELKCEFDLENVGLGTAVAVEFLTFSGCDPQTTMINITSKVGQIHSISINSKTKDRNIKNVSCNIFFMDLLGNQYNQIIEFAVQSIDNNNVLHMEVIRTFPPVFVLEIASAIY